MKKYILIVLIFFTTLLSAKVFDKASFYIAYDDADNTQYVLVMPAVQKIYTHKAGHVLPSDLSNITDQFNGFPTYNEGTVCFPQLISTADGSHGASTMAGKCYETKYFYIQKGNPIAEGYPFLLYFKPFARLYEGLAGKSSSFKVVRDGQNIYNNRSITNEDYTYFKFDISTPKILIGADACDGEINPVNGKCEEASSSSSSSASSSSTSYYHISDVSGVHVSIDIDNSNEADDLYFCPDHNFKIDGTDENGEFTDYGTWSIVDGKIVINDPDGNATIILDDQPQVHATGSIVSDEGTDTFTITSLVGGVTNDDCVKSSSSEASSSEGSSSSQSSSSEGSSSSSGLEMPPSPPDLNSSSSSGSVEMPPSPPQI